MNNQLSIFLTTSGISVSYSRLIKGNYLLKKNKCKTLFTLGELGALELYVDGLGSFFRINSLTVLSIWEEKVSGLIKELPLPHLCL